LKRNGAMFLEANGRRAAVPYLQLMDHRDDLVEYTYNFIEKVDVPGKARSVTKQRSVKIHLSDLFTPVFDGQGDFSRPPRFDGQGEFLQAGDVDVCLLPNNIAEKLGVKVSDTVTLMGLPLRVKGIFLAQTDTEQPETIEKTFNRDPLTGLRASLAIPVYAVVLALLSAGLAVLARQRRPRAGRLLIGTSAFVVLAVLAYLLHPGFQAITREVTAAGAGETVYVPGHIDQLTDLDGLPITTMRGAEFRQGEGDNPIHAPSREVVIVPRAWSREYGIFPTLVHSLAVIPNGWKEDPRRIPQMAEKLATEILNVDVFSHYVDPHTGRSVSDRISMHTATHVKGSSMMLVILVVAVLMVLAIMTGTVYE
ncbi:MAG: hypothetical protein KAX80_16345, partial [Planctomycetes bacterium]|nr:hypothetical protein [Planctomycetota bacterium]